MTGMEKRSKSERAALVARVIRMDRRGYTQNHIATTCRISAGEVSKILKRAAKGYRRANSQAAEVKVAEKVQQYRDIRVEAWEMWERAKEGMIADLIDQILRAVEQHRGPLPEGFEVSVRQRLPNTEYIRTVLSC